MINQFQTSLYLLKRNLLTDLTIPIFHQQASEDEDEKPKPIINKTAQPVKIEYVSTGKRKRKPTPHDSSYDAETHEKKTYPEQSQDIHVFLQYLGTLLKDMPQDVCLQLQMDIVNLVMKARLDLEKVKRNSSELTTCKVKQHLVSVRNDMASKNDSDDNNMLQSAVKSSRDLPALDDSTVLST